MSAALTEDVVPPLFESRFERDKLDDLAELYSIIKVYRTAKFAVT